MIPVKACVFGMVLLSLAACSAGKVAQESSTPAPAGEIKPWRTGYEWIDPVNDGAVLHVADYRHVLTSAEPERKTKPQERLKSDKIVTDRNDAMEEKMQVTTADNEPTPERIKSVATPSTTDPNEELSARTQQKDKFSKGITGETAPKVKELPSPGDRIKTAWLRFCDNGEGMDAEDWSIVMETNGAVPKEFNHNCHPPK